MLPLFCPAIPPAGPLEVTSPVLYPLAMEPWLIPAMPPALPRVPAAVSPARTMALELLSRMVPSFCPTMPPAASVAVILLLNSEIIYETFGTNLSEYPLTGSCSLEDESVYDVVVSFECAVKWRLFCPCRYAPGAVLPVYIGA